MIIIFYASFLTIPFLVKPIENIIEDRSITFIVGISIYLLIAWLLCNFVIEKYKSIGNIRFNLKGVVINDTFIEYNTLCKIEVEECFNPYGRLRPLLIKDKNNIQKIQLYFSDHIEVLFVRKVSINSNKIKLDSVLVVLMSSDKKIDELINLYAPMK